MGGISSAFYLFVCATEFFKFFNGECFSCILRISEAILQRTTITKVFPWLMGKIILVLMEKESSES